MNNPFGISSELPIFTINHLLFNHFPKSKIAGSYPEQILYQLTSMVAKNNVPKK